MSSPVHHPRLSSLIDASAIPGELLAFEEVVQKGIDAVLGNLRFTSYLVEHSSDNDAAFHQLTILSDELRLDLVEGMTLVFFKGQTEGFSDFPVNLDWRWEILKYINTFDLEGFAYLPETFLDILIELVQIDDISTLIEKIVEVFLEDDAAAFTNAVEKLKTRLTDHGIEGESRTAIFAQIDAIAASILSLIDEGFGISAAFVHEHICGTDWTEEDEEETEDTDPIIDEPAIDETDPIDEKPVDESEFEGETTPEQERLHQIHENAAALLANLKELIDDYDLIRILITSALSITDNLDEKFHKLFKLFGSWITGISKEDIEKLLIPSFEISLSEINMALEFPRDWVLPMDKQPNGMYIVDANEDHKASIVYTAGSVRFSTENGFEIDIANLIDVPRLLIPSVGIQMEVIGVKLDLSKTSNISEAYEDDRPSEFIGAFIREANVFLPDDWFSFDEEGSTLALYAKDVLVGTGGVSGVFGLGARPGLDAVLLNDQLKLQNGQSVSFDRQDSSKIDVGDLVKIDGKPAEKGHYVLKDGGAIYVDSSSKLELFAPSDGSLSYKFGKNGSNYDWDLGFNSFHLKLVQNSVVESEINGYITIPKLKQFDPITQKYLDKTLKIKTTLFFEDDGDFSISASSEEGLCLGVENVFYVKIESLVIGRDDSKAYIEVSGDMYFDQCDLLKSIIEKPIEIEKLRIYSDGSYEIEGGSIPLPSSVTMSLGPTEISITNLTLGSEDVRDEPYKFIGFDCGLSLGSSGLDLRGDGIKLMFNADGSEVYLRIEGIGVDLIIPSGVDEKDAAVIIKGYLSMREDEYVGSVAFSMPKVGLAGGAAMKMRPKDPAFVVDSFLTLPTAIPLGPSGLGIFSFRGLFGLGYEPSLPAGALEDNQLFFDFYKEKVGNPSNGGNLANGLHIGKMRAPGDEGSHNNFVIGAGLTMATMADKEAFSMEAFLFLAIPQFLLISGRANILGEMVSPTAENDVPFFGYLKITDESLALGLGADFKLDRENGDFLELEVEADLKFPFKNPSAWYIHLGTKEQPNTATLIKKIFKINGEAYLMLSAQGASAGATVKFDFKKTYGPVKVTANAFIEAFLEINFKHFQVGGGIAVGGGASVKFCGIGFSISLGAYLMATLPKPFMIKGGVKACVKVSFFFFDLKACFTVGFEWTFSTEVRKGAIGVVNTAALTAPNSTPRDASEFVSAYHIGSNRTYPIRRMLLERPSEPNDNFDCIPLDSYIDISLNKAVDPSKLKNIGGGVFPVENNVEFVPPGDKIAFQVKHTFTVKSVNVEVWGKGAWQDYNPYQALGPGAYRDSASQSKANLIGTWSLQGQEHNKLRLLSTNPVGYLRNPNDRPEDFNISPSFLFCDKTERDWHCEEWDTSHTFELDKWKKHKELMIKPTLKNVKVENYSNNFNIAQSIRMDKAGKLDIVFPEAIRNCKLKLFSTAGSAILTFYKRIDALDAAGFLSPKYVIVEQKPVGFTNLSVEVEYLKTEAIERITLETSPATLDNYSTIVSLKELGQELTLALSKKITVLPDGTLVSQDAIDKNKAQIAALKSKFSMNCLKNDPIEALQAEIETLKEAFTESKCDVFNPNHAKLEYCKSLISEWDKKNAQIEDLKENGYCHIYLHQVCWMTEEDFNFNKMLNENTDHNNADGIVTASKIIAPIWRPGESYCIKLVTEELIKVADEPSFTIEQSIFIPFKTEGPIGHFSLKNLTSDVKKQYYLEENGNYNPALNPEFDSGSKEKFDTSSVGIPELSLKSYINYAISYPNPNGNILNAKPLYYENPVLKLFFTDPQVYHMFNTWPVYQNLPQKECGLEIRIKDPADNFKSGDKPPVLSQKPQTKSRWEINSNPVIRPEYGDLQHSYQSADCVEAVEITPFEKYLNTEISHLLPSKLYTAIAVSKYKKDPNAAKAEEKNIHSYAFQTSRYANFGEHISSYQLKDKSGTIKKAAFTMDAKFEGTIGTSIPKVLGVALGIYQDAKDLERLTKYPNACERIIREYLNLNEVKVVSSRVSIGAEEGPNPILSPSGLEFNFLVEPVSNYFIGTWIRSVEPLNSPTIPMDLLQQSVVPIYAGDNFVQSVNNSRSLAKQADFRTINDIVKTLRGRDKKYITLFSDDCTQVLVLNMKMTAGLPNDIKFMFNYLLWDNNLTTPNYSISASAVTENLVEPNN